MERNQNLYKSVKGVIGIKECITELTILHCVKVMRIFLIITTVALSIVFNDKFCIFPVL